MKLFHFMIQTSTLTELFQLPSHLPREHNTSWKQCPSTASSRDSTNIVLERYGLLKPSSFTVYHHSSSSSVLYEAGWRKTDRDMTCRTATDHYQSMTQRQFLQ